MQLYGDVVFVQYMEPESAKLAIDGLHGKAVAKFSKPLIVEVSQVSSLPCVIIVPAIITNSLQPPRGKGRS